MAFFLLVLLRPWQLLLVFDRPGRRLGYEGFEHRRRCVAAILDRVLERGRFVHLDGPSGRTRHLNLDQALPSQAERLRISGTHMLLAVRGSEPVLGGAENGRWLVLEVH